MKMSGECYPAKSLAAEIASKKENKTVENMDLKHTPKQQQTNQQLLQYETMVTSAENKCSQLKGQLERIRIFYNNQSEAAKNAPVQSTGTALMKRPIDTLDMKNNFFKTAKKMRQCSRAIRTEHTGAALGTINNILAGITKPVDMKEFIARKSEKTLDEKSSNQLDNEQNVHNPLHGVEEVKINVKSKQSLRIRSKPKFYVKKSKSKATTITSSTNFKKAKRTPAKLPSDKRHKVGSAMQLNVSKVGMPLINKHSRKMLLKPRITNRDRTQEVYTPSTRYTTSRNADLVEIYHNTAIKECKSSDSDITKKKRSPKPQKIGTDINLIPPLKMDKNENDVQEPRGVLSCIYKNYTQPTISSRMKQAAKYYMNSFNIKTIPFCLVTSTSPSHNIGINIQQVMSMVKSKQPVGRLSPTLAYNIGLAAGKREENQLPFLVSSVTSSSQCPLSKNVVNYQHLQEMARNVPQDIIEEPEEIDEIQSPDTQSIIITGPSGDVKVKNRKQTVWTAKSDEKKCTCITPKGMGFQQIVNKFNGTVSKDFKQIPYMPPVTCIKIKEQKVDTRGGGEETVKRTESIPLQNKEKKLKEVLEKLHDEFEKMTITYDELVKKTEGGNTNPEAIKELEALDKELNSKEEEIIMVMSLYKEVVALKQQVKTLKNRTSKESVTARSKQTKINGCSNEASAGLLNKLLQRVQHFQTHYKQHKI